MQNKKIPKLKTTQPLQFSTFIKPTHQNAIKY